MLSKALVMQIINRGYIDAFEIQGINFHYRMELEQEYMAASTVQKDIDANQRLQLWGPQLTAFKQAIEIFNAQHEVMVIRYIDVFILNLLQQVTDAQQNRKLTAVHLYNVTHPDAPPHILYPNNNTQPIVLAPIVIPPPSANQADFANAFAISMPPNENACLASAGRLLPDVEDALFHVKDELVCQPLTLTRSVSAATTASDSSPSPNPTPTCSPSPPSSPRNDAMYKLERLEIRYNITLQICRKKIFDYLQKNNAADNYLAQLLLYQKIPMRFYDLALIERDENTPIDENAPLYEAVPLSIYARGQDIKIDQHKDYWQSLYELKTHACLDFLKSRRQLRTAIKVYKKEHLDIFAIRPPKKNLLSSISIFAFDPHKINSCNGVKRPEHNYAVTQLRKR
jgi:hypothetical protein